MFVDELTDELLDAVTDLTGSAPGPLDAIGVWQMGGNIGHGPDAAFAWDDEAYMITIEANWEHHENADEFAWAREAERVLRDLGGVGSYAGFTGFEEQEWEDWSTQVYGDSIERLARIKAEYDPENVLTHNVTVQPATPTNSGVDG